VLREAFWIYAGICVAGFLFIKAKLPETKAKTLEEIEAFRVRAQCSASCTWQCGKGGIGNQDSDRSCGSELTGYRTKISPDLCGTHLVPKSLILTSYWSKAS